jgi:glycosyltransferase involved in cell wall biosynthesis
MLRGSAAVVFTGLREEGGLALAEAMLCGAPVMVLGNGGARTIAAAGTDATRVALIEPSGPNETARTDG